MLNITGHSDLLATIEAQRREIAELEADARRYRWLKAQEYLDDVCGVDCGFSSWLLDGADQIIDAAIAGDKP